MACGVRFGETTMMPLLPRSRRGTWLLSALVWLAACAGFWQFLPAVPRDVVRIPEGFDLLGFGPEGTSALIQRPGAWPAFEGGKIELLEVPSGEPITTIADK